MDHMPVSLNRTENAYRPSSRSSASVPSSWPTIPRTARGSCAMISDDEDWPVGIIVKRDMVVLLAGREHMGCDVSQAPTCRGRDGDRQTVGPFAGDSESDAHGWLMAAYF